MSTEERLQELRTHYELSSGHNVAKILSGLRSELEGLDIDEVLSGGLHEFVDGLQLYFDAVTGELGRAFFGYGDTGAAVSENVQS